MAGFGDLFGKGSTAEQFLIWGVLMQILQPLLLPFTTELQKLVLSAAPDVPLPAEVAAAGVARGFLDTGTGQDKANDTGIGEHDFTLLTNLALHAPDLSSAFELYRRKKIPLGSDDPKTVSLKGALTDAGIPDKWHAAMAELATAIPTPAEVMNALLEGQISRAEAERRWAEAGGDPTWFQSAYDAEGEAPTPTQSLELLNRGIIPKNGTGPGAVSYEQAFLEGPWRNKWLGPFLALAEYLPPPRTVTAMYHAGQLQHDEAATLLRKQGLSATLAQAYLSKATTAHTATEKHLAKTEITKAYADKIMTRAQASKALEDLKYSTHDAALILDLIDVHTKASQLNQAVSRVRSLYQASKLTDAQAVRLLVELGTEHAQATASVATWRLTQSHQTRTLTAAQVESAWYYRVITAQAAMDLLVGMGYDDFDAWTILSVRNKAPLTDVPRPRSPYPAPPPPPPLPKIGP